MRSLSSANLAALAAGRIVPRALALMQFDEGAYGFWNDNGDIVVSGVTYHGTGALGTISALTETTNQSIPNFNLTLSGLDAEVLSDFFNYTWHQRAAQVYLALLDPASRLFVDAPTLMASGRMDKASIKGGAGQKSTLTISCEDVSRRLSWVNPTVRSDGDQRQRLSTDTFFQYVATTAQQQLYWGTKQPKPPHAIPSIMGINSPISN